LRRFRQGRVNLDEATGFFDAEIGNIPGATHSESLQNLRLQKFVN